MTQSGGKSLTTPIGAYTNPRTLPAAPHTTASMRTIRVTKAAGAPKALGSAVHSDKR